MSVYKRGDTWWYNFWFAGRKIQESAKTGSKTVAKKAEEQRRRELELGYNNIAQPKEARVQTVAEVAAAYLEEYKLKHRSVTFAQYAIGHVTRLLGAKMVIEIDDQAVRAFQVSRLKERASGKTINEEVGFLLRLLGEKGDAIRTKLRREKALKLKVAQNVGRAFSPEQKAALLGEAKPAAAKGTHSQKGGRSPNILPALALALSAGMRDGEIKNLTWSQIDFEKRFLTVGRAKTEAGEGRTIPLNSFLFAALTEHAAWYTRRFGMTKPEWFVFPGRLGGKPADGAKRPLDPTRPITSLKTAWANLKKRAGVTGRWHDARHTLITELAESGAGDQTIMDIAGHVSRQMLSRYSHIRMEAKRQALEAVAIKTDAKPSAAPEAEKAEPAAGLVH